MKNANVSELKARLSMYLAEVRNGETVVVYDRKTPVARLIPFQEAIEGVRIDEASSSPSILRRMKPVPLRRRIDPLKLLRESRDHR